MLDPSPPFVNSHVRKVGGPSTPAEVAAFLKRHAAGGEAVRAAAGPVVKKRCIRCGKKKPADARNFGRNGARPDGLHVYCRDCAYTAQRSRRERERLTEPARCDRLPDVTPEAVDQVRRATRPVAADEFARVLDQAGVKA